MTNKYDPWKYLKDECEFMAVWAAKQGAALVLEGNVGFGRDCVGIMKLDHYPDWLGYDNLDEFFRNCDIEPKEAWWVVEGARPPGDINYYHKHDCLAVLGHTHEAVVDLHIWIEKLFDNDIIIATLDRKPRDEVDALVHGFQQYVLTTQEKLDSRE